MIDILFSPPRGSHLKEWAHQLKQGYYLFHNPRKWVLGYPSYTTWFRWQFIHERSPLED